jgi:hypothetical protein
VLVIDGAGMKQTKTRSKRIKIFLSYAREDSNLAGRILTEIVGAFTFAPVDVFRDVEMMAGKNWRKAIDQALDEAGVLLVLATNRPKSSHSYTGYEVGYFNKAISGQPYIAPGIERIIIPLSIGADVPEPVHDIEGLLIEGREVYQVSPAAADLQKTAGSGVSDSDPIYKLLRTISDLVIRVSKPRLSDNDKENLWRKLKDISAGLNEYIYKYLQGRVSSETFPERKIIIRTEEPLVVDSDGAKLDVARVEVVGKSFDLFGIPESDKRDFSWHEFISKIRPEDLVGVWDQGIRFLVADAVRGDGDNCHVVTTLKHDRSFRLFVSRIVTFVSQQTEIHIYIVEIKTEHFGDKQTSRLLNAISVGLRFRFLVLEDSSEFTPTKFGFPTLKAPAVKQTVGRLIAAINDILRDAQEANLHDPALMEMIWGRDGALNVQSMMEIWEKSRLALYSSADALLRANSKEVEDIAGANSPRVRFIESLKTFCATTETMNKDFTLRSLAVLTNSVEDALKLSPVSREANGAASSIVQTAR